MHTLPPPNDKPPQPPPPQPPTTWAMIDAWEVELGLRPA